MEEIYRIDGRYGDLIARVVRHLQAAVPYAPPATRRALEALIRFYETGDDADRVTYDVAWVEDQDGPVDTINGFVENYLDARGVKGAWEALVFYVNHEKTDGLRRLAEAAPWFEVRMPWDPRWRRTDVVGVTARAIDVVVETGDAGPVTAIGINLPNDQRIRERHGSKSVSLANINQAYDKSQLPAYRREFCWSEEEVARAETWGSVASEATDRDSRGAGPWIGPGGRASERPAAARAEGTLLGCRGGARRSRRAVFHARSEDRRSRARPGGASGRSRARRIRVLRAQRAGPAAPRARRARRSKKTTCATGR